MAQVRMLFAAIAAILISYISPSPAIAGDYPGFNHPLWTEKLKDGAQIPSGIVESTVGATTCSEGVCRIRDNRGGRTAQFWFAGREASRRADITRIEVSGLCASSCVIFIDVSRAKVCLHPGVVLGFHLGTIDPNHVPPERRQRILSARIPPLADDVLKIVTAHGGLSDNKLNIPGAKFRSIWPACNSKPPARAR